MSKVINFSEFKDLKDTEQNVFFEELKKGVSSLELTPAQIKQVPARFMPELGLVFSNFILLETRSAGIGTLGTIGVLCDTELTLGKGTNANRNINWVEVVNVLTNTLTTTDLTEVDKSVKDGLKRTFSKSLTLIGAKVVLASIKDETIKELLSDTLNKGDHLNNTASPLIEKFETQLMVKK